MILRMVNKRWKEVVAGAVFGYSVGRFANMHPDADTLHCADLITREIQLPAPSQPSLKLNESRASQIMRFGYPGFDNLRTFEDFVLSYDRRNRNVHWVFEHLTPDRMVYLKEVDRSKCAFKSDQSIHEFFRSHNADYKGSGYDRGHIAAAGNHRRSQNSIEQTFLLSNMSPQVGVGFNRGKWNELERRVRKLARANANVYVCTGPLYLPKPQADGRLMVNYEVIGKTNVAVPTHFFKVVLVETSARRLQLEAYVLPNQVIEEATPLTSFQVPLQSIERAAGFLIFDKLTPKQLQTVNGKRP